MPNASLVSITVIICFLLPLKAPGQSRAADSRSPKVDVAFFANDGHGKPASRISPSDLVVLDNKRAPREVLGIRGRDELPLLLGVLVDMSGSQTSSSVYPAAVKAASEFSNQILSGSNDKAFFERFASAPQATHLMSRREFLALKIDLNPYGLTALYDGLRFACDERMKEDSPGDALRVIVLLSDGDDNHSHSNLKQAIASAQRAGVVIFAVDTSKTDQDSDSDSGFERSGGSATLQELAEETGGMAFLRIGTGGVSKAFTAIKEQIDNMYLLSFVPADDSQTAQRRSFQLKPALKKDLKLRGPKGYYGSSYQSRRQADYRKPAGELR